MSDQTARTPTALVVDDDPAILHLLGEILEEAGFAPTCVTHAQPALATLAERSFDLLLLDQWLPDGNGLQICEAERTYHGNEAAVLIVTADPRSERQVLALQLCADDFIGKPFDVEELVARIESRLRWVENARA
jgi:DNA-binding response OmpR family regulator